MRFVSLPDATLAANSIGHQRLFPIGKALLK